MKTKKLISSLCLLALTVCCLAFGVWAATTASFSASGTITFSALNADCNFDITIVGMQPTTDGEKSTQTQENGYKATRLLKYTTGSANDGYSALSTKQESTAKYAPVNLAFDELNVNRADNERNTITITIQVTNNSSFPVGVDLSSAYTTATGNLSATITKDFVSVIPNGTGTLSMTLRPTAENAGINLSNIDIFNINVEPTTMYSITSTPTNVTANTNNATAISSNPKDVVILTYTAGSGYDLPNSVDVTGATYEWIKSTGTLTLTSATGNVTIVVTGRKQASLISFTLDGTPYQAEEGMTWGEWVASDYNKGGYSVSGTYIKRSSYSARRFVCYSDSTAVLLTMQIASGYVYSGDEAID